MSDDPAFHVLTAQSDAAKRGALAIWTVYDRPDDYPDGFMARMFEVASGGEPIATSLTLAGQLDGIRRVLAKAHLISPEAVIAELRANAGRSRATADHGVSVRLGQSGAGERGRAGGLFADRF